MILKNGRAFINGEFTKTDLNIKNGRIAGFGSSESDDDIIDCSEKYIVPGFIDIHTHGSIGFDFSKASVSEILKMRRYYLKNGVTSILPTTVTLSCGDIIKAVETIKEASKISAAGSKIVGVNLEGPYLSPKRSGAHDKSLLKKPDLDFIKSLGDFVKVVNVAPEYDNAVDFIKKFNGTVSIAHTDCSYERAMEAINADAKHITHIFNAMNPLHHRNPGVVCAFFNSDAFAEIICDGVHVLPPVLKMMFSLKSEKLIVISDSMAAAGLNDGEYTLGDLKVNVKNGVAALPDGTLAGSTMNIYDMFKNLLNIGVKKEDAVRSVTENPAASINLKDTGFLKKDYIADVNILNGDFSIHKTILDGIVAEP